MKFNLDILLKLIKRCKPTQVNIGANSKRDMIKLPEPSQKEVLKLINELEKFTKIERKSNLNNLSK
jgi:hypothetical protein